MTQRPVFLSRTARMRHRLRSVRHTLVLAAAAVGWALFLLGCPHG